jgi:hypothetical protein
MVWCDRMENEWLRPIAPKLLEKKQAFHFQHKLFKMIPSSWWSSLSGSRAAAFPAPTLFVGVSDALSCKQVVTNNSTTNGKLGPTARRPGQPLRSLLHRRLLGEYGFFLLHSWY